MWFLALRNISLGRAALFQSSVLFVTLASHCLKKVGPYRMSAVLVGMIGIILLTDPFSGPLSGGVWYAVVGAVVHAGLSLSLRRLGKKDEPVTIALLLHNVAGFTLWSACLLVVPAQMQMPDSHHWPLLIALGSDQLSSATHLPQLTSSVMRLLLFVTL